MNFVRNTKMSLASKIAETFESKEAISQENVNQLIHESIEFVRDLKARLASKDETVRDAAMKDAKKLQDEMKEQMEKMSASMNIDPLLLDGSLTGAENSDMLAKALQTLQAGLADRPKKSKPKYVKEWLAS